MDDFKLKSLDEFDSLFMSSNIPAAKPEAPAAPVQSAAPKKENLIPEMESGPVEINFFDINETPAPAAPVSEKPVSNVYSAAPVAPVAPVQPEAAQPEAAQPQYNPAPKGFGTAPQSVQPPVSLYQTDGMQDKGISQFLYEPDRTDDIEDDKAEKKSGGSGILPLVGKIASIVMLALTLIAFVLGCFVTIFLNNKDSKCGSTCFATLAEDAEGISGGSGDSIKQGSLVVCKSIGIDEYVAGDIVAVPVSNAAGCKLYQITSVDTASELITIADTSDTSGATQSKKTDDIYGLATYNFGGLGKVIQFASNNAVLVCILFLLLAALWCLFIILIERSQEKNAPEAEDELDNGGLSF